MFMFLNFFKKSQKILFQIFLIITLHKLIFSLKIYDSMKSIPSTTSGFYPFKLGLANNCKPLYYVDLNSDKLNDIIAACKTSSGDSKYLTTFTTKKKKILN